MRKDVAAFVKSCITCQQVKAINKSPYGLLQPLEIPKNVWEEVSMDFITQLPVSHGFTTILVIVDRFSKSAHFGALPTNYTASKVAQLFMEMVGKLHGIPKSIVSDRDSIFLSKFWQELFKLQGTILKMSSSYHPQTDGQTEIVNKCLQQYLRCFASEEPHSWHKFLGLAEWCYNTSFHSTIGQTPYEVVYGKPAPPLAKYIPGTSHIDAVDVSLQTRDVKLQILKSTLESAQRKMKTASDKHRTDKSFDVGDLVLVKLQPYRQQSVASRPFHKLSKRYFGPFPVISRIGNVSYKLKLPESSKINPVFHISLLKEFSGPSTECITSLPSNSYNNQPLFHPAAILSTRKKLVQNSWMPQSLVQWEGLPLEEATWVDDKELSTLLPNLHLEDKVSAEEEGIVTEEEMVNGNNISDEVAELEELKILNGLRKSRRKVTEPIWLKDYYKGKSGKKH